MLKVPTSRKRKKPEDKLNLIPIMDSIFIFIFFLLMSATFLKINEVGSDVPIVSDQEPEKEKNPLALTLVADTNEITLSKGVPSREIRSFQRNKETGFFNYEELHAELINIKKEHLKENTIVFEPIGDLTYEEIVKIMDAVRILNRTDEAIYRPNKDGVDEQLKELFTKIIFGNLMS